MWGVVPRFRFLFSVAASQKKPDFGTPEMEKAFCVGRNENRSPCVPRHTKGHTRVRYGHSLTNYAMIRAKPSSFDLKAMQPRMW
jgi:hypothetical protein